MDLLFTVSMYNRSSTVITFFACASARPGRDSFTRQSRACRRPRRRRGRLRESRAAPAVEEPTAGGDGPIRPGRCRRGADRAPRPDEPPRPIVGTRGIAVHCARLVDDLGRTCCRGRDGGVSSLSSSSSPPRRRSLVTMTSPGAASLSRGGPSSSCRSALSGARRRCASEAVAAAFQQASAAEFQLLAGRKRWRRDDAERCRDEGRWSSHPTYAPYPLAWIRSLPARSR